MSKHFRIVKGVTKPLANRLKHRSPPHTFERGLPVASATPYGTRLLAAVLGVLLAFAWTGPADAEAAVNLTISPAISGNTGVRAPQQILVAGTAPAGAVTAARLIAVDIQGNREFQDIGEAVLNRAPAPVGDTGDYLRIADGTVSGRLTLGCLFTHATEACLHEDTRQVILEMTTADQTGESNPLRVDYERPQLRLERELIAPDQVLVRFTEPVRQPQPEIGADWRVDGILGSVTSVEVATAPGKPDCIYNPGEDSSPGMTGCARILHLSQPQPEDATPEVEYWLVGHMVPDREEHHDLAGNQILFRTERPEVWPALDLIRPAAPTIQSIAGKAPTGEQGEVLGSTSSPVVSFINVLAGHTIELTVDGDASAPKKVTKVVPDGANALDLELSGLVDGGYSLTAVAIDPHGNRSTDQDLLAARTDGLNTARYLLDTQAPRLLAAATVNRRTVLVSFSEAIVPAGNAGTWTVSGMNVTAEGTGHTRRLVSPVDLPNGGVVQWAPTSDDAAPGSIGRYGDDAGNGLSPIGGVELDALPAVPAPTVTGPGSTRYVATTSQVIKGTAPSGSNLVAELFNTGAEEPIAEAAVANRAWSFNQPLAADGRYSFQVRLRNTDTGVVSPRVRVPDIIRDTTAPVVDVTAPTLDHTIENPSGRRQLGAGDPVTITWTASDPAAGDTVRPDHAAGATILLVDDAGTARAVASNVEVTSGREQSFTYTLKSGDLANAAQRVISFDVVVSDLAKNSTTDSSAEILLLADRVGYRPVLTKAATPGSPGVIEAQFPVAMEGETTPADWLIDDQPAVQAVQKQSVNGATVVRLVVALANDPNARPMVEYKAPAPDLNGLALRAENGNWTSTGPRRALDRVLPAFTVTSPATPAVIDAKTVTFTGTTDVTSFPNGVAAYASDAAGSRVGSAIAKGTAGANGQWSLKVPLTPNRRNRVVLQAFDPSGNRSATRPSDPYSVVEDSVAPVVSLRTPRRASMLGPETIIRWSTVERHRKSVRLDYRGEDGTWKTITSSTADDGRFKWAVPRSLRRQDFALRIRAYDVTGKRGQQMVRGLRVDFGKPVITSARAISPYRVRLHFNEAVKMSRTGFKVDGIRVARVEGTRARRILVLRSALDRTTPKVTYRGSAVTDLVGNQLASTDTRASRGFVFSVTRFDAKRRSASRVALTWRDVRNRPSHIRGYRVYRDGVRIATLRWSARSFIDGRASGAHRYVVRVLDDHGRLSPSKTDRVR